MNNSGTRPTFDSMELRLDVDGPLYINGDDRAEAKCLSDDRVMGLAFDSVYAIYAEAKSAHIKASL